MLDLDRDGLFAIPLHVQREQVESGPSVDLGDDPVRRHVRHRVADALRQNERGVPQRTASAFAWIVGPTIVSRSPAMDHGRRAPIKARLIVVCSPHTGIGSILCTW